MGPGVMQYIVVIMDAIASQITNLAIAFISRQT